MSADGAGQVRLAIQEVPGKEDPNHREDRLPTSRTAVLRALLFWQRYGIHAFLAALSAIPTYILVDRSHLQGQIASLQERRADLWKRSNGQLTCRQILGDIVTNRRAQRGKL